MGYLDETIGAAFIGCLLTAIFYGVTCLQAIRYFVSAPPDGPLIKGLVLAVVSMDTLHMALVSNFIYTLIVNDFGSLVKVNLAPWSLGSSFIVSLASDAVIRMFFARRIWYLSKQNIPLIICLAACILLAFVATLSSTINVIIVSIEEKRPSQWQLDFALASSGLADLCIAAALSFFFYMSKSEYFEGTNNMLNALCKYTINTGLIATIWTICCLLTNSMVPDLYVVLVFYFPLSKLYVNAFLGSLNARDFLREKSKITLVTPRPKVQPE